MTFRPFRVFLFIALGIAVVAGSRFWGQGYALFRVAAQHLTTLFHRSSSIPATPTPCDSTSLDIQLKELARENAALALALKSRAERAAPAFRLIAYPSIDTWQTVRIDGGGKQGVEAGQIAIDAASALVGRVVHVYPYYSDILLITQPNQAIDARIGKAGYRALVSGRFEKLTATRGIWLTQGEFISHDSPVAVGDEVVTSGLDGIYPPSLLIGKVSKLWPDDMNLFQYAQIVPAVDFSRLEEIYLLKR